MFNLITKIQDGRDHELPVQNSGIFATFHLPQYWGESPIIIIIIIIVWLDLEWTLLFPRLTSMQKAHSWKTLQLRCPQ